MTMLPTLENGSGVELPGLLVFFVLAMLAAYALHQVLAGEVEGGAPALVMVGYLLYGLLFCPFMTGLGLITYALVAVVRSEPARDAWHTWRHGPEPLRRPAPVDDPEPRYFLLTRPPRPPAGRGPGRTASRLSRSASSAHHRPPESRL